MAYLQFGKSAAYMIVFSDFVHGWQIQVIAVNHFPHLFQHPQIVLYAALIVLSDINNSPNYLSIGVVGISTNGHLALFRVAWPLLYVLIVAQQFFCRLSLWLTVKTTHNIKFLKMMPDLYPTM